METDLNFWLQLAVMLVCIGVGGRFGGVGLGAAGGLGVSILVLGFGLQPASPPVSTLLIIVAVIACTSILQGAGGLDLLVRVAEKMLRKWPSAITIVGPFVCSLFVVLCGTAYVAFAVYPVVAEVASAGIAVVASPMSAAMAALVASLAILDVSLIQILAVSVPAFIIATLCTCLSVYWKGTELEKDPEFIRRVQSGQYQGLVVTKDDKPFEATKGQKLSVGIFLLGVITVIIFGTFKELLPTWEAAGKVSSLPIPSLIQMIMLAFGLFIIVFCKVPSSKFASGSVFVSGLIGVVGVFGVSWLTGTFFEAYKPLFVGLFTDMAQSTPMLFGVVLFCFSAVILSPSATTAALMPLGVSIGIPAGLCVALFPATCGDFIIPGGAQIGCTAFDRTGTTRLGKYVVNHSYIIPGFVHVISGVTAGYFLSFIFF